MWAFGAAGQAAGAGTAVAEQERDDLLVGKQSHTWQQEKVGDHK